MTPKQPLIQTTPVAPRSTRSPRLKDIAQSLGVSPATISNVFNRPEIVAPELRERVLTHARSIGYFGPDPKARAMRRQEVTELAVVFHHDLGYALTDAQSVTFLRGVASELDRRKLALQLIPQMGRAGLWSAAFSTTADALIVHDQVPPELLPQLCAIRKPLALIDAQVPGVSSVGVDDAGGAQEAMAYVLSKSPDLVVICSLPLGKPEAERVQRTRDLADAISIAGRRLVGYWRALGEAGVADSAVLMVTVSDLEPESAAKSVRAVLQQAAASKQRVGVVCMSDRMALAVEAERTPALIALVGFDDIEQASAHGLTTVRQDSFAKGIQAVRIALDGHPSVLLPTQLVIRKT